MYSDEEASRKGGNMQEPVRDEVLMGLVNRARTDPEFRRNARHALDRLLVDVYRYDLTEEELAACREFHARTVRLTEDQLDQELADAAGPAEGI
jgi:hypothetical protein